MLIKHSFLFETCWLFFLLSFIISIETSRKECWLYWILWTTIMKNGIFCPFLKNDKKIFSKTQLCHCIISHTQTQQAHTFCCWWWWKKFQSRFFFHFLVLQTSLPSSNGQRWKKYFKIHGKNFFKEQVSPSCVEF